GPVRRCNSRVEPHLAEVAVAAVELKVIPGILMAVTVFYLAIIDIPIVLTLRAPEDIGIFGQHVHRDDLGIAVVVDVRDVDTHGVLAGVHHFLFHLVLEGAVALIDIEIIVLVEIVADIEVRSPVVIDIGGYDAEAVADHGAVDARGFGDVGKMAVAVIAVEPVARGGAGSGELFLAGAEGAVLVDRVVEEVHVKVAVAVVVEEYGLRAQAGKVEAIFFRFVHIVRNAVVIDAGTDEKLVMGSGQAVEVADVADIDVEEAVVVYIHYGDAGGPGRVDGDACLDGDIPEVEAAGVQEEFVLLLVGGEEEVDAAVVIEVARAHAAAVIEI